MTYISSAGLRVLVICARDCRREGGDLAIASLQPQCRAIVATSGLLSVLSYYETSNAALAAPERETIAGSSMPAAIMSCAAPTCALCPDSPSTSASGSPARQAISLKMPGPGSGRGARRARRTCAPSGTAARA